MPDAEAPSGGRRRKPRIPADIARQRMLDAGVALVEREGLTVGFGHLPLEEIIADAGVSRASAYRQWGSHDAYVADLVTELFGRPQFDFGLSPSSTSAITQDLRAHADLLETPEGRRAVMLDLVRVAAERNFRALLASRHWRSYESLAAAAASPGDPAHAAALEAAARAVERHVVDTNAGFYQALLGMLGLRPVAPHTARSLAAAAHLVVTGIAQRIRVDPSFADLMVDGPALDGGTTRWHFVAHLTRHALEPLIEDAAAADDEAAQG